MAIMRALIQRVHGAAVTVSGTEVSRIDHGLLIFLGVTNDDTENEIGKLAKKCAELRIFQDDRGKMNLSVIDIGGEILAVPQFTLAADVRKGRRPSFDTAARPDQARELFAVFADSMANEGVNVAKGAFQEHMHVSLVNDGPVTFVLEAP